MENYVIQQQPMNNSPQAPPIPDALYTTPLQRSLNPTPLGSGTPLAPFSPKADTLQHVKSVRRMSAPLQIDPRLFQCQREGDAARQVRRSTLCMREQAPRRELQGLLSPCHLAKVSPRISFSYKAPLNNAKSQVTTFPTLQRTLASCTQLQWPLPRRKGERCRLSSNQFSFAFAPTRNREDYTITSIKTIPVIEQAPYESQADRRPGCDSKMASTIASSGFPLRVSDFSLEGCVPRQSSSQIGQMGSSRSILDTIPSKQLGKTLILPSQYAFGGLFQQSSLRECETISRGWQWGKRFQLCGGDMKQSIHCGPEMRSEHKFEMLGGYGREIKESTTSLCE